MSATEEPSFWRDLFLGGRSSKAWRKRAVLNLKSLGLPIGTYWLSILGFMLLFWSLIILTEGMDPTGGIIIGVFVLATVLGVGSGQLVALLRFRTWVVFATCIVVWTFAFVASIGLSATTGILGAFVFVFVFVFPWFFLSGLWSIRVNMGLLATFAPLVYAMGCILVIAQNITGSASRWFADQKWAVWDVLSLPMLALAVLFVLVYLATRQRHRLVQWQYGPGGPDLPMTNAPRRAPAEVASGCARQAVGSGCAIALLGMLLVCSSALVAPYLWRSAESDGEGDGGSTTEQPAEEPPPPEGGCNQEQQPPPPPEPPIEEPPPPPESGCNQQQQPPPPPQGEPSEEPPPPESGCNQGQQQQQDGGGGEPPPPDLSEQLEQAQRLLPTLINILINVGIAVFLGMIFLAVVLLPLWRAIVLRHLRRPLWHMTPSERIRNSWLLVEIALGDYGIHRKPNETAQALADRALATLPANWDSTALREVAEIADRATYGLGLEPSDTNKARRGAALVYAGIWDLMTEGRKWLVAYRPIFIQL